MLGGPPTHPGRPWCVRTRPSRLPGGVFGGRGLGVNPAGVDEGGQVRRGDADVPADLVEWDPALRDQPANEPLGCVQVRRSLLDRVQPVHWTSSRRVWWRQTPAGRDVPGAAPNESPTRRGTVVCRTRRKTPVPRTGVLRALPDHPIPPSLVGGPARICRRYPSGG